MPIIVCRYQRLKVFKDPIAIFPLKHCPAFEDQTAVSFRDKAMWFLVLAWEVIEVLVQSRVHVYFLWLLRSRHSVIQIQACKLSCHREGGCLDKKCVTSFHHG